MIRKLHLKPVRRSDLSFIYEMETSGHDNFLWTNNKRLFGENQFYDDFYRKEVTYFNSYFLIYIEVQDNPIGFVYSYGADSNDRYCYATMYLKDNYRQKGYGAIAGAIFLNYLFSYYDYRKIYFDVFQYNTSSYRFLISSGCVQEGCLKQHKYFNGHYYDLLKLALYRDIFYTKNKKIIKFAIEYNKSFIGNFDSRNIKQ